MIFRRREQRISEAQWIQLCRFQQKTMVEIAHLALRIANDPALVTPDVQDDLCALIRDCEDRLAVLDEHFV